MDIERESIIKIIKSRYWREKLTNTIAITAIVLIGIVAAISYPAPRSYIVLSIPFLGFITYMTLLYIDVKRFGLRLLEAKRRGSKYRGGMK